MKNINVFLKYNYIFRNHFTLPNFYLLLNKNIFHLKLAITFKILINLKNSLTSIKGIYCYTNN
jgi:hypothetical protein